MSNSSFHLNTQRNCRVVNWTNFSIFVPQGIGRPKERETGNGQLVERSEHRDHLSLKVIILHGHGLWYPQNNYNSNMLLQLLSHFSRVRLCATPQTAAHRDSPGKNTGVGCHFLLHCMKVKSESEVAQSCPTLIDPMDCSLPGSSIHGIFQARVLEGVAIAFSIIVTSKSTNHRSP